MTRCGHRCKGGCGGGGGGGDCVSCTAGVYLMTSVTSGQVADGYCPLLVTS